MNGIRNIAEVIGALVLIGGAFAYVIALMRKMTRQVESEEVNLIRQSGGDWKGLAESRQAKLLEAESENHQLKEQVETFRRQLNDCREEKLAATARYSELHFQYEQLKRELEQEKLRQK